MQPPPAFDSRSIHFEDRLADCQSAVVPHEQEHERELEGAIVDEQIEAGHEESDAVEDELELLVVVFVADFLGTIED
jgi:hypothetical protein